MSREPLDVLITRHFPVVAFMTAEGQGTVQSMATPRDTAGALTALTVHYHQQTGQPLEIEPQLAELLTAAGWTPPPKPADSFTLSDRDFLELALFDGKVENEGFEYARENYSPDFADPGLAAWAKNRDNLSALHDLHEPALETFWDNGDADERLDAHQAAKRVS